MTLQKQEFEIPLNAGMATKPVEDLQQVDTMRSVVNLHWRELGGLEKAAANDIALDIVAPTGSEYLESPLVPYGVITRSDAVSAITKNHGLVTNTDSTTGALKYAYGNYQNVLASLQYCPVNYDVSRRFIERAQFSKTSGGIVRTTAASYQGVQVVAWIVKSSTNYLYMKAIDSATGAVVTGTERVQLTTASGWQISACEYQEAGKLGVLIVYTDTAAAPFTVKTIRWAATTKTFVADSNLTTNSKYSTFGLRPRQFTSRVYFMFTDNTSGFAIAQDRTIASITSTHTSNHDAYNFDMVQSATRDLFVTCTTATAWAEVLGTPANRIVWATAAGSESFRTVTAAREVQAATNNDAIAYVSTEAFTPDTCYRVRATEINFDTTTPVAATNSVIPNGYVVAPAQLIGRMAHVPVAIDPAVVNSDTSVLVLRYRGNVTNGVGRHDAVARICHDRYFMGADEQTFGVLCGSYVDTSENMWLALTADHAATTELQLGKWYPQTFFVSRIATKSPLPMPYAQCDSGVVMSAGGICWEWDGDVPAEATPLDTPRIYATRTGGGSFNITSSVSYIAIRRWVDALGRLHRTSPSNAWTFNGPFTSQTVDVYVTVPPTAAYDGNTFQTIDYELYATEDGGSAYYLVGTSLGSGDKDFWDITAGNGCFVVFQNAGKGFPTKPALYSTGAGSAEITPEPTPAFSHLSRIVDRMWAVDAEDRTRVWFSKPLLTGYQVEWSTVCTLYVGDDCIACVDVAGVPTIFARNGIYQVFGEGPDALGNGTFSAARKLPHEVDCLDPVSVCRTPLGVVFRGRRGFYTLSGELSVSPFLLLDPDLTIDPELDPGLANLYRYRVSYLEQTNEIHIATETPARYVYNLIESKWSKTQVSDRAIYDLCVARGQLWRLEQSVNITAKLISERLYTSFGATYNASTDSWELQTPWIKLDGIAGYARIWELLLTLKVNGTLTSVSTLTVLYETRKQTSESGSDTFSWTGTELNALSSGVGDLVTLRFKPADQHARAFRIKITEASAIAGSGTSPVSLRVIAGVDGKAFKRTETAALKGA